MATAASSRTRPQAKGANGYVSEFEQFMNDYLSRHPEAVASQREGWRQFWERDVDFQEWEEEAEDSVPTKSYNYF